MDVPGHFEKLKSLTAAITQGHEFSSLTGVMMGHVHMYVEDDKD